MNFSSVWPFERETTDFLVSFAELSNRFSFCRSVRRKLFSWSFSDETRTTNRCEYENKTIQEGNFTSFCLARKQERILQRNPLSSPSQPTETDLIEKRISHFPDRFAYQILAMPNFAHLHQKIEASILINAATQDEQQNVEQNEVFLWKRQELFVLFIGSRNKMIRLCWFLLVYGVLSICN